MRRGSQYIIAPRRRWSAISLRTSFGLLSLGLALLAIEMNGLRQCRRDARTLAEARATVFMASRLPERVAGILPSEAGECVVAVVFDPEADGEVVEPADLFGYGYGDQPMSDICAFFLTTDGQGRHRPRPAKGTLPDVALNALSRCRDVQYVSFKGMTISDEQLPTLASLPQLRYLDLRNCCVTPEGVAPIKAMPQLLWIISDDPRMSFHRN